MRVGQDQHAAGLAANAIVEAVLDAAEALFVDVHVAQNGSGQIALGIKALIFRLKIDAAEIERLECGRRFPAAACARSRRTSARRPGELRISSGEVVQHAAEQPRHHLRIGNFRRHGEAGIHRRAHGQRVQIAVENVRALGADFDDVLLLVFGAGQEIGVAEQLQIAEPPQRRPVHRASTAATINSRVEELRDSIRVPGTPILHKIVETGGLVRAKTALLTARESSLSRAHFGEDCFARGFKRRDLAGHRHRQSQLAPGNLIDPRRSAQARHLQLQFLIEFGRLRVLGLQRFELVAQLDAGEMLPGIEQGHGRDQAAQRQQARHLAHAMRRHRAHQTGIIDRLDGCETRSCCHRLFFCRTGNSSFSATRILALRARGFAAISASDGRSTLRVSTCITPSRDNCWNLLLHEAVFQRVVRQHHPPPPGS